MKQLFIGENLHYNQTLMATIGLILCDVLVIGTVDFYVLNPCCRIQFIMNNINITITQSIFNILTVILTYNLIGMLYKHNLYSRKQKQQYAFDINE